MNFFNSPTLFRHAMNLWPPFLGAGIRVKLISPDWRQIVTQLRHYGLNRNYMGTHFGGSLFSMTDPFYMLMLIRTLGKDYNVWDKTGSIEFIKPVKGTVTATFILNEDRLRHIRQKAANGDKHFEIFSIDIVDKRKEVIAKVTKTIYIRKKPTCTAGEAASRRDFMDARLHTR
jgi:acyl-coenzyme A thioesterase PaaI-like protein